MTGIGRVTAKILSALLLIGLIFLTIAAAATAVAMAVLSTLPAAAFELLPIGTSASLAAAMFGSAGGRIALAAILVVNLAVALVVVVMLRRILQSAIRGMPFDAANVGRLRVIAAAYAVELAARFIIPPLVPPAIAAWLADRGWAYSIGDLGPLLVALVLAEVFREGLRLRDEADLTV